LSLQPEKRKPPVGYGSLGRRQSRSLRQQSHPTRVVAGVGILRHTSAHKGRPLFRRRAPAPNTVDPRGLLAARRGTGQPGVRRPHVIDGNISINGVAATAICGGTAFSSRRSIAGSRDAHTVAEGDVCWGVPRGAGGGPAVENGRRGEVIRRRQDASGEVRCLRGVPRFPVEVSTGSAPLQSG